MHHSILNNHLQVTVQEKGTEISSIKSLKTGLEYIWNADPDIWGSHAPVLFPTIGAIKNKEATINGSSYQVPRHGFIRHNESIFLKEQHAYELKFQLDYSDKTLSVYPYKFRFNISFRLEDSKLVVAHRIENLDDKAIYFALGGHPGFNCPLHAGERYEDYYLEFEKEENVETTLLSSNGLITDQTEQVLTDTRVLPLRPDLFDNDALILKDLKSRKVSLKSHKSEQVLTVSYQDFAYLGIWAKPNAPFVCIEPWLGIADHENTDGDFLKKDGLITLPQGEEFTASFSIEIAE